MSGGQRRAPVRERERPKPPAGARAGMAIAPAFAAPLTHGPLQNSEWDGEKALAEDRAVERRLPWKELMVLGVILLLVIARVALVH